MQENMGLENIGTELTGLEARTVGADLAKLHVDYDSSKPIYVTSHGYVESMDTPDSRLRLNTPNGARDWCATTSEIRLRGLDDGANKFFYIVGYYTLNGGLAFEMVKAVNPSDEVASPDEPT
jgi:hypothetical protein